MSEIKWIKLYTNIFDNRKIKQIETLPEGDGILVIWLKLLCLAGITNDSGLVYFTKDIPYTEQMLAGEFARPLGLVQMALSVFEKFGMIQIVDNVICVSNWERYQNIEGMDKVREQNRVRQKRWYDKQKALPNVSNNVTVTQPNATDIEREEELDKEKEKEEDKEIDKKRESKREKKSSRFSPPTIDEIKDYCCEKNYPVKVAEPFFNYYDSKNWMVGKNKMSNWHSALAGWVGREKDFRKEKVDSVSKVESFV